ncbi:phosphopantetheine-binding protein [Dactylosporangium sp. CA-139066]|uniref:phosphopantetheine-binding protein n=1 Tax=Dactylosporangium sp. CA-139066 TaxID=3239930 RepID=UPI003D8AF9CF
MENVRAIEAAVVRMWTEILPNPPRADDDDFFDLGGQSLHLVSFLQRVHAEWGVELPVTDLFADAFTAVRAASAISRQLAEGPDADDLAERLAALPDEAALAVLAELADPLPESG